MSGRTVEIAEHLWAVLETMARDMATEPRALVNQAVFNWARRNGYAVSAAAVDAKAPVAAPVKAAPPPASAAPVAVSAAATARAEVVLVEGPVSEPKPAVAAKVSEPAPAASQAARVAAIDADVDRYCLAPVIVDAEFELDSDADSELAVAANAPTAHDADDDGEEDAQDGDGEANDGPEESTSEAPDAPRGPPVDLTALRAAAAARIVAIDRAVDEVTPRSQASAPAPIPVPVAASASAPAVTPAPVAPRAPEPAALVPAAAAPRTARASAADPAPTPASAPAAAAASVHSRPTVTVAPAALAAQSPALAPAAVTASASKTDAAPAPKGRQRMDTSELNNLLGEVDDILGQSLVRDTALSPAIPFVLELRVRGTEQVCTVASDPVVIGRGPHCDLVVHSAEASREHAVVSRQGASYVIEDRGSSNGTWFGSEQVRSREIHSGDVFRIGSVEVVASFKIGGAQAKAG